jgi:hypothetical protein
MKLRATEAISELRRKKSTEKDESVTTILQLAINQLAAED